jgi:hypothetical protein
MGGGSALIIEWRVRHGSPARRMKQDHAIDRLRDFDRHILCRADLFEAHETPPRTIFPAFGWDYEPR